MLSLLLTIIQTLDPIMLNNVTGGWDDSVANHFRRYVCCSHVHLALLSQFVMGKLRLDIYVVAL